MGYRSDVAYKITFHNADQWNVFLLEAKSKPETRRVFEDEDLTVDYEHHEIKFLSQGTKWYTDYPDVQCHIQLMDLCEDYNNRNQDNNEDLNHVCSYLFRRIGESEDDCESHYGGDPDWDDVYLSRQLVVSWA